MYLIRTFILAIWALTVFPVLAAENIRWPERPIKLIVPYPSGGPTDLLSRAIADRMKDELNVPIVVENRPGAGGGIGATMVANSNPDGYTIMLTTAAGLVVNPKINPSLSFTPDDFSPISLAATYSMYLISNPDLGFKNIADLIEFSQTNPGQLSFASSGIGTSNHLAGELFSSITGISMLHIPYQGVMPALADVIGGRVSLMFDFASTALPQAKAGKVRVIASTGSERSVLSPEIPTIAESGFPEFNVTSWFALFGPKGIPGNILDELSQTISSILTDAGIQKRMLEFGYTVSGSTPEQLRALTKKEELLWADVVEKIRTN
jgi:tripartite-type tricarboxylate transporter receptor subunit TctC